ncbi:MAG TPA: peptidoglycan-binding domain-containing protein [Clostridia bacterium]|nr:peptidoglycan-binding domain-containing protein [Clostridia bacterium]
MNEDYRPILAMGSMGPEVEMLQRILFSIGYETGPIDGIFGPLTRGAVVSFQLDNGLVPDGIVGPRTWKVIDLVYP